MKYLKGIKITMLLATTAFTCGTSIALENWQGFYIGLNGGYVDGRADVVIGSTNLPPYLHGGFGGSYLGYNLQITQAIIAGIEIDINVSDVSGINVENSQAPHTAKISAFGSARARLGVLLTPDTLLFSTAGWAWANVKFSGSVFGFGYGTNNEILKGAAAGVGLEHAISKNVLGRIEYRRYDFRETEFEMGILGGRKASMAMETVSFGIAMRW